MSDIENIYKEGVALNLKIELHTSKELGFNCETEFFVITGETETGKMILYKDNESDNEFVFTVEYEQKKLFSKKTVKRYTHWHPADCNQALKDMISYMQIN